jgi:hypothetical protein
VSSPAPISSPASARRLTGSVTPRLWTPPLRDLTDPAASLGHEWIRWADEALGAPFDPWQRWVAVHAGELLADGRPRFRRILLLVARQNGKTHLPSVLAGYWSLVDQRPYILGTSTKLEYAKLAWLRAVELLERAPALRRWVPARRRSWLRFSNGETSWSLPGSQYRIAAANDEAGRSLSLDALIMDELRQHTDRSAWSAAIPAMQARPWAQAWMPTNAGDATATVLNEERAAALRFIETGAGDARTGIFEYSSPDGASPDDPEALAAANPQLGARIELEELLGQARTAMDIGGDTLARWLTEVHCRYVPLLDPAVDMAAWAAELAPVDLVPLRHRLALGVDVSPDQLHATAVAAAAVDDRVVAVDVAGSWTGAGAADQLQTALPDLVARLRPRMVGWMPGGPAASVAAALADRNARGQRRRAWPPPGVRVAALTADVPAVCMSLANDVKTWRIVHPDDPLLLAHLTAAQRAWRGAQWVFDRPRSGGHVDAAYALAAAVWLARTMPAPVGAPRVITADDLTGDV